MPGLALTCGGISKILVRNSFPFGMVRLKTVNSTQYPHFEADVTYTGAAERADAWLPQVARKRKGEWFAFDVFRKAILEAGAQVCAGVEGTNIPAARAGAEG